METKFIETRKLKQHPFHKKIYDKASENVGQLTESIQHGILQPIVINLKNEILSGYRRYLAARATGIEKVPVLILNNLKSKEEEKIILNSNRHRDPTIRETIREIQYYFKLYRQKPGPKTEGDSINFETDYNKTKNIVAALINRKGFGSTIVDECNKVDLDNNEEDEIIQKVEDGKISLSAALEEIKKLKNKGKKKKEPWTINMLPSIVVGSSSVIESGEDGSEENNIQMNASGDSNGTLMEIIRKKEIKVTPYIPSICDEPYTLIEENCETCNINMKPVKLLFTSPPYYNRRNYPVGDQQINMDNQIGHEDTPELYIERICNLFNRYRDIITDDGFLVVNIGESTEALPSGGRHNLNIPAKFSEQMIRSNWYLVDEFIWGKFNAVSNSPRHDYLGHEQVYVFCKNPKIISNYEVEVVIEDNQFKRFLCYNDRNSMEAISYEFNRFGKIERNGTVIRTSVASYHINKYYGVQFDNPEENHVAVMTPMLALFFLLKYTKIGDNVCDVFSGIGTTGAAAILLGRTYYGIELCTKYYNVQREVLDAVCAEVKTQYQTSKQAA